MKVFVTRDIPQKGIDVLAKAGLEVTVWKKKHPLDQAALLKKLKGYDGLICPGPYKLDESFFAAVPQLKAISLFSVGFDNVDVDAATKSGIPVGNTPGVLSKATADVAFLLMQMVARKAAYNYRTIVEDNWVKTNPTENLGVELEGKTLGILGLGRIGYEMATICKNAFNMKIVYHNRHKNPEAEEKLGAKKVSFAKLLSSSDVISIHAALTSETKDMFNADVFKQMKSSAILVNTSRGGLVNEKDLAASLKKGEIWGAGLDVTSPEPMSGNNPLLKIPTVVVLPHIGSATFETRGEMARVAAENVVAGLAGKKVVNCVNPGIYK